MQHKRGPAREMLVHAVHARLSHAASPPPVFAGSDKHGRCYEFLVRREYADQLCDTLVNELYWTHSLPLPPQRRYKNAQLVNTSTAGAYWRALKGVNQANNDAYHELERQQQERRRQEQQEEQIAWQLAEAVARELAIQLEQQRLACEQLERQRKQKRQREQQRRQRQQEQRRAQQQAVLERVQSLVQQQLVAFVALDLEWWEHNSNVILEFGWSCWNTVGGWVRG